MKFLTSFVVLLVLSQLQAQQKVETFDSFEPQLISKFKEGKAVINYEDVAEIPADSGKWFITNHFKKKAYKHYSEGGNEGAYIGRSDSEKRARGLVYVFNNTTGKVSQLKKIGFDYFSEDIGVEKNIAFQVWGVKDPDQDGWNNQYVIGYGGTGAYADNWTTKWENDHADMQSLVIKQNLSSSSEWTTLNAWIKEDLSEYDWIFLGIGHCYQSEQTTDKTDGKLFGIDNVVLPDGSGE